MQKNGEGVVVYFFDWIKVLYRKGVSGRERERGRGSERCPPQACQQLRQNMENILIFCRWKLVFF